MVLRHRAGRKHGKADPLSRRPVAGVQPEELPYGGCKYCVRAHENWAEIMEKVDKAVPLAVMGMQGSSLLQGAEGSSIKKDNGEAADVKGGKEGVSNQKNDSGKPVQALTVGSYVSGSHSEAGSSS